MIDFLSRRSLLLKFEDPTLVETLVMFFAGSTRQLLSYFAFAMALGR
jgi:hypothetical protein